MRRLSVLLALTAPFLLSGCELLERLFGGRPDEPAPSAPPAAAAPAAPAADSFPSLPAADIRNQGPVSGRQLVEAAQAAGAVPASPELDPGRVTFDGAGTLPPLGMSGSPMSAPLVAAGPRGAAPLAARPLLPYNSPPARAALPPPPPDLSHLSAAAPREGRARGAGPTLAQYDSFQRVPGLFARVYDVISRAGWGARPVRARPKPHRPSRVTVHHTDGPQTFALEDSLSAMRGIQGYHQRSRRRRGRGWEDIGYHFLIDGAGRVFEGRRAEVVGSHSRHHNTGNVGIALMGNFDRDRLSEEQRDALVRLVTFLSIKYRREPSAAGFIEPHEHYAELDGRRTACPGRHVSEFLSSGELLRRSAAELGRVGQDARFQPALVAAPGVAR